MSTHVAAQAVWTRLRGVFDTLKLGPSVQRKNEMSMVDSKRGSIHKRHTLSVWRLGGAILFLGAMMWLATLKETQGLKQPEGERFTAAAKRAETNLAETNLAETNLALVAAVKKRDAIQVKSLLARGASPNARDNSALQEWQKEMAKLVTEQDPASGNLRTHKLGEGARPFLGPTVLMIAAYENDDAMMRILARAGADVNATGVSYGATRAAATDFTVDLENRVTLLMEAMMGGKESSMRLLLKSGAKVNARDSDGLTALDWAHNMWPTSGNPAPAHRKFLETILRVLEHAGGKPGWELNGK
jgi:hypothetical protein